MNDETKSALDEFLRTRKEAQDIARTSAEKRESAEDAFLDRFTKHCETVIQPTMTAFGDYLKGHECPCEIERRDQSRTEKRVTQASITLHLFPGGRNYQHQVHDYPMLSVIAETRDQKVRLHQSTLSPGNGGQAGSIGTFSLEHLTPEFLEERLVALVRKALR
jgi:hypothetical protein